MSHHHRDCRKEKEIKDSNISVNINYVENNIAVVIVILLLLIGSDGEDSLESLREPLKLLLKQEKENRKSFLEALEALKQ